MNIEELKKSIEEELESFSDITEEEDPQERFDCYEVYEGYRSALEHVLTLISEKS